MEAASTTPADARLRLALDAARMVAWEWSVADGSLYVSDNASELFGLPAGFTLNHITQGLTLVHPDDLAAYKAAYQAALDGHGSYLVQYRLTRPVDGQVVWMEERGQAVADDDGEGTRLFGVVMDITDRKQSENQLQDARSRLDSTLAASEIGTWEYDTETDTLHADANLARMFGVSEEEAAGGPIEAYMKAIHPDDREQVVAAIQRALLDDAGYEEEYRLLNPDGSIRWVVARGRVECDDSGRKTRLPGVVVDITDRRENLESTRKSEEFRRLVFESVKDFSIFTADLDGRITTWNNGAENVFGFSEAEAVGQPAAIVFTPEDRANGIPEKEMESAAETGKGTDERWHLRKDGTRFFASGMVRPIRNDAGALIGFTKVARDVTATKNAQETLRQNEERYRALFGSMDEGFCIIKMHFDENQYPYDYEFLESNPAFETIIRLGNPTGRWASEVMPDLDRTWHDIWARIIRSGEPERFEQREASFDGRTFSVYAFPIGAPGEHKVAILFNDITHRKAAEVAARDQAGRLQKLAEFSVRLTDAHDVNSVLGIVTEAARDLIPAHHVATTMILDPRYPQPINVVSHSPERRDTVGLPNIDGLTLYTTIQQANQSIRLTTAQLDADPRWNTLGKIVNADPTLNGWLAAPLIGHDGASMGLLQLSDKVAGEFTAEDEIILIQLTRIASIAVENARLYEELRGNDQRKDEFLAMLAHELRNPLGAISSGVDLVQRVQKPELLGEIRTMIQHQVKHLTHLIDDLLDVSRITQGKIELRKETVELTAITRKAAELAQPQIDEKRHELNVSTPSKPVLFLADPTRVEQMLSNLLTNAAKYSEPGRSIDLSARVEGKDVVFRIRDQGYGISGEMLPKIFGLFTQVDATIDRSRGGLGIGLTLVRNLVELHGGTVAATSEGKDQGSEFTIRLPIGEPASVTMPAIIPLEPTVRANAAKRRILIIDDNRDTAKITSRLLDHQGYQMMMAHDGHEGIEAAKAFSPDVVLLDIGLPGLNGYEVAAALRDHECCRNSIFVAVSGYGEAAARERSKAAGIDYHLTKPLDFDKLDEILATLAHRESAETKSDKKD